MKSRGLLIRSFLAILLSAVFLLSSCIREESDVEPVNPTATKVVELAIAVPSSGYPDSHSSTTRAITEKGIADYLVEEIDVLVFSAQNKLEESFHFEGLETLSGATKSVKIRLNEGKNYTIVTLANCHELYSSNELSVGDDKSRLYSIVENLGTFGSKWNSIPDNGSFRPFPMWGETTTDITQSTHTVEMTARRMFAKANVSVAYNDKNDFILESISVYNYNKSGKKVPTGVGVVSENRDRQSGDYPTPLSYKNDNSDGAGGTAHTYIVDNGSTANKAYECIDEIFIPEVKASDAAWAWDLNTCIVIGGTYKGEPSFYRLEFVVNSKNVDIERNNKYLFNISAINIPGYSDEEQALKNRPANLEYSVLPWDESEIGDIHYDGSHFLSVRPSSLLEFFRGKDYKNVNIKTNHELGWSVFKITSVGDDGVTETDISTNGWITTPDHPLGSYFGTNNEYVPLRVDVETNEEKGVRKGYVYLKAGSIEAKIEVVQGTTDDFGLKLLDEEGNEVHELYFPTGMNVTNPIEAKSLRLVYSPANSSVTTAYTDLSAKLIGFESSSVLPENINAGSGSGYEVYSFKPVPFTAAEIASGALDIKVKRIRLEVERPSDKMLASTTLMIYQQEDNLVPAVSSISAPLIGGKYNFKFSTNTEWTVELEGDATNLSGMKIVSPTSGEAGNNQVFELETPFSTYGSARSFNVVFKSPNGEFEDKRVAVTSPVAYLNVGSSYTVPDYHNNTWGSTTYRFSYSTNIPLADLTASISSSGNGNLLSNPTFVNATTMQVTIRAVSATESYYGYVQLYGKGSFMSSVKIERKYAELTIDKRINGNTYLNYKNTTACPTGYRVATEAETKRYAEAKGERYAARFIHPNVIKQYSSFYGGYVISDFFTFDSYILGIVNKTFFHSSSGHIRFYDSKGDLRYYLESHSDDVSVNNNHWLMRCVRK